ncbi:DNA repair protein XRCC1-like [Diadema setosum]|uniref:DNA repair protein XRCC1-like n=1 Tax=Diadema setosum TaxID=31175 RepID=UPI003B3A8909
MTIIQIQRVVSCSSEDTLHRSDNLLKGDSYKKWTCGSEGEKQASAILQLEKSTRIHSIDVGNEASAFVEILGGNAASDKEDFQVILVASSFMSPVESRNNTNINRVRMFGPESLSKAVADKKFDRIKIVCTQPFNKRIKYGLSFIKFHGPPGSGDGQPSSTVTQTTLGRFKLKDEGSKSSLSVGSFFKSREKESPEAQKPQTAAAAVRAASNQTSSSATTSQATSASPHGTQQPSIKRRLSEEEKKEVTKGESSSSKPHGDAKSSVEPPSKKTKDSSRKPATGEAFSSLMKGVVFVLSGFQNPLRGELRQKASDMGAQYRGDWGPGCTHLICAFANTPKFNQVKGKGRIVKKEWVSDCYRKRTLLPWKRYQLTNLADSSSDDSRSEDEEAVETPVKAKPSPKEKSKGTTPTPKKSSKESDAGLAPEDDDGNNTEPLAGDSSGEDTEDEIQRVRDKPAEDPYGGSTDEEEDSKPETSSSSPGDIPDLPDFLSGKHFLLYGKFDPEERRQVNRFIVAFNGLVENYMSDQVNYVITNSSWDDSFEQALGENSSLTFVRPRWLFSCNEKLKMVPYQPYIVVPAN